MIIANEGFWGDACLTERHALVQAEKLLPDADDVVYFGFPWSALFDLNESSSDFVKLTSALFDFKEVLSAAKRVVTVCEHTALFQHQALFFQMGVTDIFWPYLTEDHAFLPVFPSIKLYPFPLLPSTVSKNAFQGNGNKAIADFLLPSDIFDLGDTNTGLTAKLSLIWQAVNLGKIPVRLSDKFSLPGNLALWSEATIKVESISVSEDSVTAFLQRMLDNPDFICAKRQSLKQLKFLYGPDFFIYDICLLFTKIIYDYCEKEVLPCFWSSVGKYHDVSIPLNTHVEKTLFFKSVLTALCLEPSVVMSELKRSKQFKNDFTKCFDWVLYHGDEFKREIELFYRLIKFRKFEDILKA